MKITCLINLYYALRRKPREAVSFKSKSLKANKVLAIYYNCSLIFSFPMKDLKLIILRLNETVIVKIYSVDYWWSVSHNFPFSLKKYFFFFFLMKTIHFSGYELYTNQKLRNYFSWQHLFYQRESNNNS